MNSYLSWFHDLIGTDSRRAAADRAGIAPSTLNLQYRKGVLSPETVIALARAYNQNPISSLVATGYLEETEGSGNLRMEDTLQLVPDHALLDELARRINHNRERWDIPLDEALDATSNNRVTPIRPVVDDDDPIAGIDPTQYAAHPRTENLDEDNPTP